jgi:hypothetical protein
MDIKIHNYVIKGNSAVTRIEPILRKIERDYENFKFEEIGTSQDQEERKIKFIWENTPTSESKKKVRWEMKDKRGVKGRE